MPRDLFADIETTTRQPRDLFAAMPTANRLNEMPAPTFKEKAYQAIEGAGEISKAGWRDVGNFLTFPAKAGFATGREIARIADQERSVVVPGNDLRVAKEAMIDTGKQLAKGIAYPYMHPIQSFKEQPITTTLAWSPLALAAERKLGLTPTTRPIKVAAKAAKLETKATNKYREMLKPTAGDIKAVEVKRGLSIDDSYNLAAKENLPIGSSKTGNEIKLDTTKARNIVKQKASAANKELTAKLIESRQTFDIRELGKQAMDDIGATVKDATDAKSMKRDINRYITDTMERNGNSPVFTTAQLNDIKSGIWKKSYNALKPTANASARKFGHIIADTIEQSITDVPVKELNNLTSKYLTLNDLLENAHGRIVSSGKVGQFFGRTIGAGVGGTVGYAMGGPTGAAAGTAGGGFLGGEFVKKLASPERMSKIGMTAMEQSNKLRLMNTPTDRMIRGIDRLPSRLAPPPNILNNRGAIGKGEKGEMVTLYHASPELPIKGNWKKGTYFADTEQSARYYAESHHEGKLSVAKVEIPKELLHKNKTNSIHQLLEEYPISQTSPSPLAAEAKVYYHQSQNPDGLIIQKGDLGYKKAGYSQAGEGIYFSPNKELVQSKYGKSGGKLVSAKLDIKNPLDLGDKDAMYFDGRKVNYGDIVVENFKRYQRGESALPEPDIILQTISKKAKEWLTKNGYDAVTGMKGEMWSAPEMVIFDKSKIIPSQATGKGIKRLGK